MTRIENVLEQVDEILFHNYFAWKQLLKSLNVYKYFLIRREILSFPA